MNKKENQSRIVIDVEKTMHKRLKSIAVEEDKSLRTLMLEAIDYLLKTKSNQIYNKK